jgi:hypothetical protein
MNEWINTHLQWFVDRRYKIITFNNSWKLIHPPRLIHEWHSSDNHSTSGTFVPTKDEAKEFGNVTVHHCHDDYEHLYLDYKCGTMFLNVIYNMLLHHNKPYDLVVIGCDFMYNKDGDTFYSSEPGNKARNDPLMLWGKQGLKNELNNSQTQYDKRKDVNIYNASVNNTLLPYKRFVKHLK